VGIRMGMRRPASVIEKPVRRIEKKKTIAARVETLRAKDLLLAALLQSHDKAVRDPDNELVHLYEIRDALKKRFGGESAARRTRDFLGCLDEAWQISQRRATAARSAPRQQCWNVA